MHGLIVCLFGGLRDKRAVTNTLTVSPQECPSGACGGVVPAEPGSGPAAAGPAAGPSAERERAAGGSAGMEARTGNGPGQPGTRGQGAKSPQAPRGERSPSIEPG